MTKELNNETYEQFINENNIALIDFWAEWCNPCKMLTPIMEEISNEATFGVGKVNVDENKDLAVKYGVKSIPTVLILKDGKVVDKVIGLNTKQTYLDKINNINND
jgi:thioredoxin 1